MQGEIRQNVLTLENQNRLALTGVERVDAFSDREIRLTVSGKKVRIEGSKLKVLSFSEGSGSFSASGQVDGIRFMQGTKGISHLFK